MQQLQFHAIGVERLRMLQDGDGVTTLIAGYGCPLRCKYCLNPQCFLWAKPMKSYTLENLLQAVRMDDLYFQATGGGVVFGGGEPLLQAEFIHAFRQMAPVEWKFGLESSLAVSQAQLEQVISDIDYYIIDIKDMNPDIYRTYTGRENRQTLANLEFLAEHTSPGQVKIRIPLIAGFNTEEDRNRSREQLYAMGFRNFDLFSYVCKTPQERMKLDTK